MRSRLKRGKIYLWIISGILGLTILILLGLYGYLMISNKAYRVGTFNSEEYNGAFVQRDGAARYPSFGEIRNAADAKKAAAAYWKESELAGPLEYRPYIVDYDAKHGVWSVQGTALLAERNWQKRWPHLLIRASDGQVLDYWVGRWQRGSLWTPKPERTFD